MTLSNELIAQLLQLDREGISECYDVLKHHRASLDRKAKNAFSVGDLVTFDYKGKTIEGHIDKINRTRVIIAPLNGGRKWNCYPSSLKPLDPTAFAHSAFENMITKGDMTKLNDAIDEAAKKLVAQNQPTFNPLTGDFE